MRAITDLGVMLRFNDHTVGNAAAAGGDVRPAVDFNNALTAESHQAKRPPALTPMIRTEDLDMVRQQRLGNALARTRRDGSASEVDLHLVLLLHALFHKFIPSYVHAR
jgi:hypothetical protein